MKRITYISRLAQALSIQEIESIGVVSSQNNREANITGLLVYFEKLFFQILEGEDKKVDLLYAKIGKDPRHSDILRLKTEEDVRERLFPSWSMKTINLDNKTDDVMRPIKILLQSVVESHTIIERYTQPAVLKLLNEGINPLTVSPAPVEKIILFADIVGYSSISTRIPVEETLLMINTYLEICSRIILDKGGEVNKFMGDGLMAYFEIGHADDAIQTCLDIMAELQTIRALALAHSPLRLLKSGFGIAQGSVIEGNMGSKFKTDYTIIGNAVNIAAQLEALTREVQHALLFSGTIKRSAKKSWSFLSLGKYNFKGEENKIEVYSIDHELVRDFKTINKVRN